VNEGRRERVRVGVFERKGLRVGLRVGNLVLDPDCEDVGLAEREEECEGGLVRALIREGVLICGREGVGDEGNLVCARVRVCGREGDGERDSGGNAVREG